MVNVIDALEHRRTVELTTVSVQLAREAQPVTKTDLRQAIHQLETAMVGCRQPSRLVAIIELTDTEGIVRHAQVGSTVKSKTPVVEINRSRHTRDTRPQQSGNAGSHRGIPWATVRTGRSQESRQHPVCRCPVVAIAMRKAPDDRHLVHDPGLVRQQFADPQTGQAGRD